MKTKNLLIACAWLALSIVYVLLIWLGAAYSPNPTQWLINMQNDFLVIFVVTLIFSGAIAFLLPEKTKTEPELINELQDMRSGLEKLDAKVDEIKKAGRKG
jgi:hypothetical protein